jgi:hypothetical protein
MEWWPHFSTDRDPAVRHTEIAQSFQRRVGGGSYERPVRDR